VLERVLDRGPLAAASMMMRAIALGVTLVTPLGAQQQPPPPPVRDSAPPRQVSSGDPLQGNRDRLNALSAQARSEQDQFERNHRSGLRFYNGGADARCDVDFGGNLCYWNNNGDVPPPEERNDAKIERLELLETLKRAQVADPTDDWVSGMRVRYAHEAGQMGVAAEAAALCAGTPWWCAALQGFAAHVDNRYAASSRAFARALDLMPLAQRCEWTDLSWWLELSMHNEYKAIPLRRPCDGEHEDPAHGTAAVDAAGERHCQ
jgi:hypothetical protein